MTENKMSQQQPSGLYITEFKNQFEEWQVFHAFRSKDKAYLDAGSKGRVIHVVEYSALEAAQAEIADLKEEIFCPGIFKCAKCGFKLIAKIIDTASGNIGMNRKPQECSNGCGPMWKVTWKESAKEAFKAIDKLFEEKQSYKAQADKLAEALELEETFLVGSASRRIKQALEAYAKFKKGGM